MNNVAQEITRSYRLDFRNGETHWDDPIPPEVTSQLLGRRVTCVISRASLLAWSLMMDVREVEVADVTADGWMEIAVCTGPDFDHTAFMRDIAATVTEVTQVRSHLGPTNRAPWGRSAALESATGQAVSSSQIQPA
jgi:hypothetical protein